MITASDRRQSTGATPASIDALVLCGGQGTRLRSESGSLCKPMVEIAGRPFLDILIDSIGRLGPRHIVLCAGYRGHTIVEHYTPDRFPGLEISCILEDKALGTGGAVRNAASAVRGNTFLVFNGDTLARFDAAAFLRFHRDRRALVSVLLSPAADANDCGQVSVDARGRIVGFAEKASTAGSGYVNAGVYLFERAALERMPQKESFSLERDFFPALVGGEFYGHPGTASFVDIGTPERLAVAREILGRAQQEG